MSTVTLSAESNSTFDNQLVKADLTGAISQSAVAAFPSAGLIIAKRASDGHVFGVANNGTVIEFDAAFAEVQRWTPASLGLQPTNEITNPWQSEAIVCVGAYVYIAWSRQQQTNGHGVTKFDPGTGTKVQTWMWDGAGSNNPRILSITSDAARLYTHTFDVGQKGEIWKHDLLANTTTLFASNLSDPFTIAAATELSDGGIIAYFHKGGVTPAVDHLIRYAADGSVTWDITNALGLSYANQYGWIAVSTHAWLAYDDPTNGMRFKGFDLATGAVFGSDFTVVDYALATGADAKQTNFLFEESAALVGIAPIPAPTPLAPQAPCNPQTSVETAGTPGNFGCNPGGVGWTRTYTGPYGDVPQHADPAPGETLTGKDGVGIEPWAELIHQDYPSGDEVTYKRAIVPLGHHPDKGGYKPDGLRTFSAIRHALGNEQGGIEAARITVEVIDLNNPLMRPLLATQDLEGSDLYLLLSSDPAAEDAA